MKRNWPYLVGGILLAAMGLIWTLQGLNILGGSSMSGSQTWAIIGPLVMVVGLVLIGIGILTGVSKTRRPDPPSSNV